MLAEIRDRHRRVGKPRCDFELAAQGFDVATQGADMYIGAAPGALWRLSAARTETRLSGTGPQARRRRH
jgi:hypothetical protein